MSIQHVTTFINAKRVKVVFPMLLMVVAAALYGQYLWNPIVFDDIYAFLLDNDGHQPITRLTFKLTEIRSLPYATLAWTQAAMGQELIYFRLGNLLLHAAVVISVYFLVLQCRAAFRALQHAEPRAAKAQADAVAQNAVIAQDASFAFIAALMLAAHPVAVYSVAYLVQRTTLMATLFGLLAVSSYLKGSLQRSQRWLWLSVVLYYFSAFSKEHAIMLVLVFPLITVVLFKDWPQRLKQGIWVQISLFLVAFTVLLMRTSYVGVVYELGASKILALAPLAHPWVSSVLTQCWLFFKYLGLWLLPNPAWMSIDMREPLAQSWQSVYLLAPLAYLVWGATGLWLVLRRGRLALAGLAMLYPWLLFGTELAAVRIQEPFVLYRSYLWLAGGIALAFSALPPVMVKGAKPWALVAVFGLFLFGLSMDRLLSFSHPLLLWDDAEKLVHQRQELPGAARIYYNRGTEYLKWGELARAQDDLKTAVRLQPAYHEAYGNLGVVYLKKQQWQDAADAFDNALAHSTVAESDPQGRYYSGRAQAREQLQDTAQARLDYEKACRIAGRNCDKVH